MVVIGLGLTAAKVGSSELQPVAFNDNLLVGILGKQHHYSQRIHSILPHRRHTCGCSLLLVQQEGLVLAGCIA